MDILQLIGRNQALFDTDIQHHEQVLSNLVADSRFLVIGGAGSIGQAVSREIFKRKPKVLHVVDISENNMVELVRDIRSTLGYIDGDFSTFAIDCGSTEFEALMQWSGGYDYVLNLSALKHVRSEKDPFTLMRMVDVNIINTNKTVDLAQKTGASKYFCVSTDKAANPVNMMGASKRIMEMYLIRSSLKLPISTARFANVAFSDGSLLHGFNQRFAKRQPIPAPRDVRRYFITPQESGEMCLMSCLLGENRDIFFPKLSEKLHLITFSEIAGKYLAALGYEAYECATEDEARDRAAELIPQKKWPCYFFDSDTTGEKDFEEFFTDKEVLDMGRFDSIGIIKNEAVFEEAKLEAFLTRVASLKHRRAWDKSDLVGLFHEMIPDSVIRKLASIWMEGCNMQRFFDILLSGIALLVFAPLLVLIVIILRFTGEGEIFFVQQRVGKNGKHFGLMKFVTMLNNSENIGTGTVTVKNDPRILPMGHFLRKSKINEIPQLLNILKGDMSIIGPRPQAQRCFNAFTKDIQEEIVKVRPGLSWISSIIFRDKEKFLHDAMDPVGFYDNVIAP